MLSSPPLQKIGGIRWPRKSLQMATGQGPGHPKRPPLSPRLAWPLCPAAKQPLHTQRDKVAHPFCPLSPKGSCILSGSSHSVAPTKAKQLLWRFRHQRPCERSTCLCLPLTRLTPERSFTGQGGPPQPQAGSPRPRDSSTKGKCEPIAERPLREFIIRTMVPLSPRTALWKSPLGTPSCSARAQRPNHR